MVNIINGEFINNDLLLIVICCFCIILSKVDCVFVGVWLILLVSKILVKVGFFLILNLFDFILYKLCFIIFEGIKFGVNCICEKFIFKFLVKVLISNVLLSFGIFLSSIWLLVKRMVSIFFIMVF